MQGLTRAPVAGRRPGAANVGRRFPRPVRVISEPSGQPSVDYGPADTEETSRQHVYVFGEGQSAGGASQAELLGGKGANLAEMAQMGLSVPPGFTLTTETCADYHDAGGVIVAEVWEETMAGLAEVERMMGQSLGTGDAPLLLSVRSGAAVSMPGMMDTVLNLGLNDEVVEALAAKAGPRFAFDSYRRFLDMFGDVVLGVPHKLFEEQLEGLKAERGVAQDNELSEGDLRELVGRYKAVYEAVGQSFPADPLEQLRAAISAVFNSWQSERALKYMEINKIKNLKGTAVNVQAMAFGNLGATSGTGVLFTRNPSTGENALYGEFLINAQGEDVVAGIRTPEPISAMEQELPEAYAELVRNTQILEAHFGDMQDIEFTVQEGRLFMLQCRSGKRTGAGAVKIAVDMVAECLVDSRRAIGMVEPAHLDQLLHPQFEDVDVHEDAVIAKGLPASPGAAVGQVVFSSEAAEEMHAAGRPAILVRMETSPEDVGGMHAAVAILTARGGMTSHAAVVARGWGKCCVTGCGSLSVEAQEKCFTTSQGITVGEHEWISVDGSTGAVYLGKVPLKPPSITPDLATFMAMVDEHREMRILANADTPADAAKARENGAQGIGLVRTEHMFFESEARLLAMRKMIMAIDIAARECALADMLPFQRSDFEGIFRAMDGLPVTIRLLDPPLHEFLPDTEEAMVELARECCISEDAMLDRMEALAETNPMLGHRGCRLAIAFPEIAKMQARAIVEAACNVAAEGVRVQPDIMVPLVGSPGEFAHQASLVRATAAAVFAETGVEVPFRVGTMIETPRAALLADQIAEAAEFFSFGTNDLTQMTYGLSRDDCGKFLGTYLEEGIIRADPFEVFDQEGVGQLVRLATERGRAVRPDLKVGICGEHGGEPQSVHFFSDIGLDYASCSPFRVPIARLAAAQAAISRAEQTE